MAAQNFMKTRPRSSLALITYIEKRASSYTASQRAVAPPTAISAPARRKGVFDAVPTSELLRSLTVLSVAALPTSILTSIIRTIRRHSTRISASPLLQWTLRRTFYDTFCIGESKAEIAANILTLRSRGITGVVLSFAREAKLDKDDVPDAVLTASDPHLKEWLSCNLETIEAVNPGDYIAVRFTGAGPAALRTMETFDAAQRANTNPDTASIGDTPGLDVLRDAIFEICAFGEKKGVKVLVDAESSRHQRAIDCLTLESMAAFNKTSNVVVFNTYQMYLRSSLDKMKLHLEIARSKGYTAGLKLVRGAYMYVEPERMSIIHDSKTATDDAYDAAVKYLLNRQENGESGNANPWKAEVMLATHNTRSVDAALSSYSQHRQTLSTPPSIQSAEQAGAVQKLVFAQLMGMADEVTMSLANQINQGKENTLASANVTEEAYSEAKSNVQGGVGVFKYTVWGSFEDCLLYMLRRAEENKDAVARSRGTAWIMLKEVSSRLKFWR